MLEELFYRFITAASLCISAMSCKSLSIYSIRDCLTIQLNDTFIVSVTADFLQLHHGR